MSLAKSGVNSDLSAIIYCGKLHDPDGKMERDVVGLLITIESRELKCVFVNKKVSYSKQIARHHSCHRN